METIVRSITVDAEPARVFRLISEPVNLRAILPDVDEIEDIERLPGGSWRCRWSRKFMNVHFEGCAVSTPVLPGYSLTTRTTGGITSTIHWILDARDGHTVILASFKVTVPEPMTHRHSRQAVREALERDVDRLMVNVSTLAEALAVEHSPG